jgi:hypothetical protein
MLQPYMDVQINDEDQDSDSGPDEDEIRKWTQENL